MSGLMVAIFVKESMLSFCSDIRTATVRTGYYSKDISYNTIFRLIKNIDRCI